MPPEGRWVFTKFGSGEVDWLWKDHPGMPRIDDFWIRHCVHLYRSVDDAKNPEPDDYRNPRGASGALFVVHTRAQPHFYVVTNRHVIEAGCCVPKLFTEPIRILDHVTDDWLTEEVKDDLAILPLSGLVSADALCESHFPSVGDDYELELGVGDDVFMCGRFWGQAEHPVTRFGNVAAWPARNIRHANVSGGQESILVEMRSHNGYSGSPVFLYINPHTPRPWMNRSGDPIEGPERYAFTDNFRLFFIGIDWGHIGDTAMAAVVPWYRIGALLHCPKLIQRREERNRAAGIPATLDWDE